MKTLDHNWQTLGSAALRAAAESRRAMLTAKVFGPLPSDDDLRRMYPIRRDGEVEAA